MKVGDQKMMGKKNGGGWYLSAWLFWADFA